MNRLIYFELCTYAFLQVWKKQRRSIKERNELKQKIADLSKQDRFLLLDIAAQKWVKKRKLQTKKDFH